MRRPATLWLSVLMGLVIGGWMLADGVHHLRTGDYIRMQGRLGPWADVVAAGGVDPHRLAVPFVVLGLAWMAACAGLLACRRWGWRVALGLSVLSLAYLGIGTVCALVALGLLLAPPTRRTALSPGT